MTGEYVAKWWREGLRVKRVSGRREVLNDLLRWSVARQRGSGSLRSSHAQRSIE